MGVEVIMSKEDLCKIYALHRRSGFSDKDVKRCFERACTPASVSEALEELQGVLIELEDLRAYKSLAIELANRKGFDSVAAAIDSIDLSAGVGDDYGKAHKCYGDEVKVVSWDADEAGCIPVISSKGRYCVVEKSYVEEALDNPPITKSQAWDMLNSTELTAGEIKESYTVIEGF